MKSSSYVAGNGIYHRFDARAKGVFTVLMIVVFFLIPDLASLYAIVAAVLVLAALEIGPAKTCADIAMIAPMIAVMFIFMPLGSRDGDPLVSLASFTLVTRQALDGFLTVTGRFVGISMVCSLMMQTTRGYEVMVALSWFRLPESASVVISLAMRFIPDMAVTFRQIRESQRLRLPDPQAVNVRRRPFASDPQAVNVRRRPFASIFPTLVSMIVSALRTIPVSAAAIDLRGYGRRNSRTRYRRLESGGLRLAIHFLFAFLVPAVLTAVALMTA